MPRTERFTPVGVPLHVTQRGNFRATVFRTDGEYQMYAELLCLYARKHGNRIAGYCLMPNHVHLVLIPDRENGVSEMFQVLAGTCSRLMNERLERAGHIWQSRFWSAVLDWEHYRTALAYVDLNPVRAGLVREAAEYRWSSAAAHAGVRESPGFLDSEEFRRMYTAEEWSEVLKSEENEGLTEDLRRATRLGQVAGSDAFVKELEAKHGKVLLPKRQGRPLSSKAGA